jgi:hypothetical protein
MAAVIGTQPVGQRKTKGAQILNALVTLLVFNLSDPLTTL